MFYILKFNRLLIFRQIMDGLGQNFTENLQVSLNLSSGEVGTNIISLNNMTISSKLCNYANKRINLLLHYIASYLAVFLCTINIALGPEWA